MSPRNLLTLLLCLLAHAGAAADLQFGKPLWNFDGTAAENSFNLLSIEVRNTGSSAFEGAITLDSSSGGRAAAPYTAPVFLAPGTSRWVQFYPYFGAYVSATGWELSWKIGNRSESASLEQDNTDTLKSGPPAVVVLASLDDPTLRGTRIPVFDEALFPPTLAATTGLHAVVLDHQPRLDPARRTAFLDWLRAGGIVHLLPGADGAFPEFTDEFAPLNFPGEKTRIGAGTVAKHTATRSEITPALLATAGYPAPTIENNSGDNNWSSQNTRLLTPLASLTKPNIAWPLIYLLTIIYVALIGPTFYLLRKRDYRLLLGGFILTVAAFAWLFTVIGKRGYGEKQIYHSIAIARALGGDRWDVRHWTHTFATSGDRYTLAYPGGGQLYAAISERGDAVRSTVLHGKDSALLADIPLFSSRPFMHRGTMTGPDFALTITKIQHLPKQVPATISDLTIRTGPGLPADLEILAAAAEHRGNYYQLTRKGDTLTTSQTNRTSLADTLGGGDNDNDHSYNSYGYYSQTPAVALANLKTMAPTLARHISNTNNSPRKNTALDPGPDTIRIFLYGTAHPAFRLTNDRFQAGTEYILYTQDLPVPVSDL